MTDSFAFYTGIWLKVKIFMQLFGLVEEKS